MPQPAAFSDWTVRALPYLDDEPTSWVHEIGHKNVVVFSSHDLGDDILRAGGLGTGGFNFDAKLRRPSIDLDDLFHAHIGGMDAYALAFKLARKILAEGKFEQFVAARYASYDAGYGRDIEQGRLGFRELSQLVLSTLGEPRPRSGKQEYLENLLASYLHG